MNTKRILICSGLIWFIGTVFMWLTCGWLFRWVYEIPPIIWKTSAEMMNVPSMVGANILGILTSLIFVLGYAFLFKGIPGKGIKKGISYGIIVWLLASVSGLASMPFFMTIAPAVVIYWIIQALVMKLISGLIVGKLYKED